MTIEIKPVGNKCNLSCTYCYEEDLRENEKDIRADYQKIKEALFKVNKPFTVFGGEPLLLNIRDLERYFNLGYKSFGGVSIQTNGSLIQKEHIELFKKYRVHVGISVDGPGPCNDARFIKDLKNTRSHTNKTMKNIDLLLDNQINVGLIVTLNRYNASDERLDILCDWFKFLDGKKLKSSRLHLLEVNKESIRESYALTDQENINAMLKLIKLEESFSTLRFDIGSDITKMLSGNDQGVTCIFMGCDPYATQAVHGIERDGQITNCGRVAKNGYEYSKSEQVGFERYINLYFTEQEDNGCKGCDYFLICKGNLKWIPFSGVRLDIVRKLFMPSFMLVVVSLISRDILVLSLMIIYP